MFISFNLGGEKLNIRHICWAAVMTAAVFLFIPSPVSAQNQDSPPENQGAVQLPSEDTFVLAEENAAGAGGAVGGAASIWIILRMVLVLALAALAIYGVVFFIKRLARPPEVKDPHLKVLASAPLSGGTFAAVISVGSKAWLVGGGADGVSPIAEIDETEALESMLIDYARKTTETRPGRFPDFRSLLGKMGSGSGGIFGSHAESLRKQRDRLKGL